jgi:hypothetical protein
VKKIFGKTLSHRKILAVAVLATIAVLAPVAGALLANYLVPSHVRVTGTPGLLAQDQTGPVTNFEWGDVQQTTSATKTVTLVNTGQVALWLNDHSLSTQNPLPTGVTLTWNFAATYNLQNCPGQTTGILACLQLQPNQSTAPLTLTLAVAISASQTDVSFTTVFTAYSTPTG